ncbi:hypothetical protein Tco_0135255 [Tanacetum coccineum]
MSIQEIAPTTSEGVNQRVIELSSTVDQEDEIIYSHLDDARYDRALLRARVNRLDNDRPFHRRTALLIEEEARLSPDQRKNPPDSRNSELLKATTQEAEAVSRDPKDSLKSPQGIRWNRATETAWTC